MLTADVTIDPASPLTWFNLGLAGAFAWAGIRGLVWLKPAVDQLKSDMEDLREENRTLNRFLREAIVPAVTTANDLSEKSTEALNDSTELMRQLLKELRSRDKRP